MIGSSGPVSLHALCAAFCMHIYSMVLVMQAAIMVAGSITKLFCWQLIVVVADCKHFSPCTAFTCVKANLA